MKNRKKAWFLALVLLIGTGVLLYQRYGAITRVALVNFPSYEAASIIRSCEDGFIRTEMVATDKLEELKGYDAVLMFAMGLKIDAAQRARLQKMAAEGLPFYSMAATNPENAIGNLDSVRQKTVADYMANGSRRNYQALLRYIRTEIDGKRWFATPADTVVRIPDDVFYHLGENDYFESFVDYRKFYERHYKADAPKVAVISAMSSPFGGNRRHLDSLIVSLERSGLNVYPIASMRKRMEFLREISPDAVVYMPHGRLVMMGGERGVEWLKELNIPLFCPLTIMQPEGEWKADKMGMLGGFLSQSVVMPELDGAIYPYVVNAEVVEADGLHLFHAMPDRLDNFTRIICNFLALKVKPQADKRVAVYYFKGPGQSALTASGLEVMPSLYNLLRELKRQGYNLDGLPSDLEGFRRDMARQGCVLGTYAQGAFDDYLKNGNPQLVEKSEYEDWAGQALPPENYADVVRQYGVPGEGYMGVDGKYIAVARVQYGNVALLPQPMAAAGDDAFQITHGVKVAPPHNYLASYLWMQYGFRADALIHFGTHGGLEYTPEKQVALSGNDWPDRLVGNIPHFYYYTIGNVGEGMIAKRRSYATLLSYLTPPFMESGMRGQFRELMARINSYYKTPDEHASLAVKKLAVQMGLHRDLRLDSALTRPYTEQDIERLENFAEEISNEKMTGQLYTLGEPFEESRIRTTVLAMAADPVAYGIFALDKQRGKVVGKQLNSQPYFTQHYLNPAKQVAEQLLDGQLSVDDALLCRVIGLSPGELSCQRDSVKAIGEVERALKNIVLYRKHLSKSPARELQSFVNALNGGYVAPSSGGDAIANPQALPTGRNLYAVNAEATPSATAWEKGVALASATIDGYREKHGAYPKKVSYTFWSSEFVETEGVTIAQVLYMLGVEPVRDRFGRVSDLRLIPAGELGRPRIDVLVQTSGQFRDLAASRLMLINRAVQMAADADGGGQANYVTESTVETERQLVEKGLSPKEARELSTARVFGGLDGGYGTGITGMVEAGDRWEDEQQIAETYLHNMGAMYISDKNWGTYNQGLLRAALNNTDIVVQPRQSNTWGALSLDHVYEFMGGISLAVRNVTGKDPDAVFADYRNRNRMRVQDLKEAIGVEARSTVFNPAYISEKMKGGASAAGEFSEVVKNAYGWNVMKPAEIDKEMWDKIYEVYVKDEYKLGVQGFFEEENPAALQEMTAVMLETARKGMWKATENQLKDIAGLHTDLVRRFGPSGSGFTGNNAKLQAFIAGNVAPAEATAYTGQMKEAVGGDAQKGMVLKKESTGNRPPEAERSYNGVAVVAIVLTLFIALLLILKKKRKGDAY